MKKYAFLAACVPVLGLPDAVLAQDGSSAVLLDEVVVTARKRLELVSDTPISMQVVTGEELQTRNIGNLQDMSASIPNVDIKESTIGDYLFIRGIGSGINEGFEQTVGTYVDGVYYGRSQLSRAPFYDLERVEVLRGPQGILFGKNTVAGAVSATTADPTAGFEGYITGYYDEKYDEYAVTGAVNVPLSDTVLSRIAFRQAGNDGFVKDLGKDSHAPDSKISGVRLGIVWQATDDLSITTKLSHNKQKVNGFPTEIIKCSDTFRNETGDDCRLDYRKRSGGGVQLSSDGSRSWNFDRESLDSDINTGSITIDWDINDYTLTAITGYVGYDLDEYTDVDFSVLPTLDVYRKEYFDQWSQEIRLNSPTGETIEWLAGLYFQHSKLDGGGATYLYNSRNYGLPNPNIAAGTLIAPSTAYTFFDQETDSWAIFGQLTWHISDSFRTALGLRYAHESKEASTAELITDLNNPGVAPSVLASLAWQTLGYRTYEPIHGKRTEGTWTPSLNVEWDVSDDVMVYASVSKGFKGGGFDFLVADGNPDDFEFEDENVVAYEIGSKMKIAGGRGELGVALFHSIFKDVQSSIFDGKLDLVVENVGETVSQGVEFDGRWKFSEELLLGFSGAWLDAETRKFPNAQCTSDQVQAYYSNNATGICSQDLKGTPTIFAPEYTLALNLTYTKAITDGLLFSARIDMRYMDDYFTNGDLDPVLKQDAFTRWDARVGISDMEQTWDVALVGKNITDETVILYGADVPSQAGTYYAQVDRPRTWGIQATWRF
jgi:iron complex outermembrane receptor protein